MSPRQLLTHSSTERAQSTNLSLTTVIRTASVSGNRTIFGLMHCIHGDNAVISVDSTAEEIGQNMRENETDEEMRNQ